MRQGLQRALYLSVAVGLLIQTRALAADGSLPAGSMACTDQIRSTTGARVTGFGTNDSRPLTWSVLLSLAKGGSEAEILRVVQRDPPRLPAPIPGAVYYRACLTNTSPTAIFYRFHLSPNAPILATDVGLGAHRADLAPGGTACGEFGIEEAALLAQASQPVTWTVRGFDNDMNWLEDLLITEATELNRLIDSGPSTYIDVCATNTSQSAVSVSFELL
jgi:hypothetical protein